MNYPLVQQNPFDLIDARKLILLIVEAQFWHAMVLRAYVTPPRSLSSITSLAWSPGPRPISSTPTALRTRTVFVHKQRTICDEKGVLRPRSWLPFGHTCFDHYKNGYAKRGHWARPKSRIFSKSIHRWLKYRLYSNTQKALSWHAHRATVNPNEWPWAPGLWMIGSHACYVSWHKRLKTNSNSSVCYEHPKKYGFCRTREYF